MLVADTDPRLSSIARGFAIIGDRWTLLILRDCFLGVSRFDALRAHLGISRSLLARRLRILVGEEILRREVYQTQPRRYEYRLTEKGLSVYPALVVLMEWAESHYGKKEAETSEA